MNTKQAIKNVNDVPNKFYSSGGTISGAVNVSSTVTAPSFVGSVNGNASTASKLQTSRNISLTGSVTGSVKFDGSGDVSISTATNHTHDYIGPSGNWRTNGGQDLIVWDKRALVGMTNGQLHLGYGGDFSDIRCGNGYTVWHSGNFDPNSKANNHDHPYISTSASCNKNWNWSGKGGQPTWLWGGEDGTNMYVYNPSNFSVNYANNSGKIGGKTIFVQQSQPSPNAVGDIWISW